MKKIVALCIFVCAFVAISAFAQATKPKVVVVPLSSSKKAIVGGFSTSGYLPDLNTYLMSGTDVSLPVDGTCMVTATAYVSGLDGGDTVKGAYFRTARQTGGGSPGYDGANGAYMLYVGVASSTAVSATYAWQMTGGTTYRFGCGILGRPATWADDYGYCRVTWVCSAD